MEAIITIVFDSQKEIQIYIPVPEISLLMDKSQEASAPPPNSGDQPPPYPGNEPPVGFQQPPPGNSLIFDYLCRETSKAVIITFPHFALNHL